MPFDDFASLVLVHAFANNIVLVQLLGVSAFFAFSRTPEQALELAVISALLLLATTAVGVPLLRWGLHPLGLEALDLMILVGLGAGMAGFIGGWLEPRFALMARRQGTAIYLAGGNSAVIGFTLQTALAEQSYWRTLIAAAGTGLGLALLLIAFAALRQRLEKGDAPAAFRGAPLMLISAAVVAMSLLGLRDS